MTLTAHGAAGRGVPAATDDPPLALLFSIDSATCAAETKNHRYSARSAMQGNSTKTSSGDNHGSDRIPKATKDA